MSQLQATWTPDATLFFWATRDPVEEAARRELPGLLRLTGRASRRPLARPGDGRQRTPGVDIPLSEALSLLVHVGREARVSDSLVVFSAIAKLAVRLAAARRVVPTARNGQARWKGLLLHADDQRSFDALVTALPPAGRALPTSSRGRVTLPTAEVVVREVLDGCIDVLYRQGAWPGTSRGWARDLAQALRGDDPAFVPREARHQAIPDLVAGWAAGAEAAALGLELRLGLPRGKRARFPLNLHLVATHAPSHSLPVARAWTAGERLELAGREHEHPAHHVLRALARASRVWTPLADSLEGTAPTDLILDAEQAWSLLDRGARDLRAAGFRVRIPDEFEGAGSRRIRARMRIEVPDEVGDGPMRLDRMLTFRWEVALGDTLLTGADFQPLAASGSPIVRFRDQWVLLDPREVARLPDDLDQAGTLPAAAALRAVLTGQHEGVPVVADARLDLIVEALRDPPPAPLPDGFVGTLRPYQERGFAWLATLGRLGLGACLADDMGLGKTVQLIAHLLDQPGGPHLVVCPTSVLGNWTRELRRFAPGLTLQRYHGLQRRPEELGTTDVVLTSYGLLARDIDVLEAIPWRVVALDEAQSIKNPDSQRARAARRLQARHRVALSGTPVENRLDELWSLMEFLVPGLLGPRRTFQRNVAVPIERFGDEALAHQLKLGVSPFLLRRLKTDPTVISDLPEKIERKDFTPLTAEQARLYRQVADEAMEAIATAADTERRGRVLAMLTALKQVCNHPDHYLKGEGPLVGRSGKLERLHDLLEQILDRGERAIMFTQYREMGDRLQRWMAEVFDLDVPFLHGGTPAVRREDMVRAFQDDDDAAPVLLISLRAGGTGLNLTRATHVVHYDRWWNPAVEDQATDRAYRIGQTRNVQVHKMVSQGTLEERIDAVLEDKRALAESVVGSGEGWVTELDDDALRALVALGDDAIVEDER